MNIQHMIKDIQPDANGKLKVTTIGGTVSYIDTIDELTMDTIPDTNKPLVLNHIGAAKHPKTLFEDGGHVKDSTHDYGKQLVPAYPMIVLPETAPKGELIKKGVSTGLPANLGFNSAVGMNLIVDAHTNGERFNHFRGDLTFPIENKLSIFSTKNTVLHLSSTDVMPSAIEALQFLGFTVSLTSSGELFTGTTSQMTSVASIVRHNSKVYALKTNGALYELTITSHNSATAKDTGIRFTTLGKLSTDGRSFMVYDNATHTATLDNGTSAVIAGEYKNLVLCGKNGCIAEKNGQMFKSDKNWFLLNDTYPYEINDVYENTCSTKEDTDIVFDKEPSATSIKFNSTGTINDFAELEDGTILFINQDLVKKLGSTKTFPANGSIKLTQTSGNKALLAKGKTVTLLSNDLDVISTIDLTGSINGDITQITQNFIMTSSFGLYRFDTIDSTMTLIKDNFSLGVVGQVGEHGLLYFVNGVIHRYNALEKTSYPELKVEYAGYSFIYSVNNSRLLRYNTDNDTAASYVAKTILGYYR